MAAKKKTEKAPKGARKFQKAIDATTIKPRTKQGKEREDATERRRFTSKWPGRIEAEDVVKKSDALAKVIQDRAVVSEERSAAASAYRGKLKFFDERLTELAESVASHTELRDVKCVEFLLTRTHEVVIIRQDTGEQVGEARAATVKDRQGELFDEPNPEAGKSHEGDPKKMLDGNGKPAAADAIERDDLLTDAERAAEQDSLA